MRQPLPRTRVRQQPPPVAIARAAPISISTIAPEPLRGSTEGRVWGTAKWGGAISPIPIAKRLAAARSRSSTNANSGIRHNQRQEDLREMREWRRSRRLVFWNARMRARPAGPAESAVFHNFARGGPTKEAHPRALNRVDGLLRSVAGQGHARFVCVTLPRGASDQPKWPETGRHWPLTP